jgi:hypothetical protein
MQSMANLIWYFGASVLIQSMVGNDKTRTPGPWTTFVDLVHGLHSWTTDHSRGPLSWTTCEISPTEQ